jgi:hypothetical protein
MRRDYSSLGCIGSTSTTPCTASTRLPVARAPGHCVSWHDYSSSGLHRLYCAYVVHPDAPSRHSTSCQSFALALAVCPVIPLCIVTTRLAAATDILRLRRASGCLSTSRGSSSTTSLMPRVRVPRHVAWLVVDYFTYAARLGASARRVAHMLRGSSSTTSPTPRVRVPRHVAWLVVDYFTYAARLGASARRVAHMLRGSSSTTSPTPRVRVPRNVARLVVWLVVDYFTYAVRLGALARGAARRVARRRLLRLRRVCGCLSTSRGSSHGSSRHSSSTLRLRRASECLSTSRDSSRGSSRRSSSTTSPTPRVRVPWLVTRLVSPLVVDYAYAARLGASARCAARHAAHLTARRRLLRLRHASGCLGTSRDSSLGSSRGSSLTTPCAVTSSCGHNGSTSATPCVATTCLAATLALLQVHHVPPRRRLPVTSRRPFISTSFPN